MPPKRRKASEPALPTEPKRRSARLSTKPASSVAQVPIAEASKVVPKASTAGSTQKPTAKLKKSSSATSNWNALPEQTQENPADEPLPAETELAPQKPTALTITSDLVKKPVECHQYIPVEATSQALSILVFTHGAGGTLAAPAVVNFCTGFSASSPIFAFQGSMNLGARVKGFHACTAHLGLGVAESGSNSKGKGIDRTILLGGRSMGARAAVIAASEILERDDDGGGDKTAARLILVSYPLKGPKDIRDQILLSLPASVNVLFIIGDKDAMCPLDLLNDMRGKMVAKSQLIVVKGADHGMHVKPAKVEKQVGEETGRLAADWVNGKLDKDVLFIEGEEG